MNREDASTVTQWKTGWRPSGTDNRPHAVNTTVHLEVALHDTDRKNLTQRSMRGKWGIAISHEQERIRLHAGRPSADTHHERKQPPRVTAGEQDGEPRDHDGE